MACLIGIALYKYKPQPVARSLSRSTSVYSAACFQIESCVVRVSRGGKNVGQKPTAICPRNHTNQSGWHPQWVSHYPLLTIHLIILTVSSYDTGSIGAITIMPSFEATFGVLSPIIRGFTVSLIMLAGAVPSVFAGQLADRFGRLPIVCLGATVFVIGAIMECVATGLPLFWVGRIACGLGEGIWLSNVSV